MARFRGWSVRRAKQERNCEDGDALSAPERTELFGSFGLHADRRSDDLAQSVDHGASIRRELRRLQHDCGIDVRNSPAFGPDQCNRGRKQLHAVGTLPLWICVGEMLTDVAQARRTEQGIGNRMRNRIRVGMSDQTGSIGDVHATEHEATLGIG